MPGMHTKPVSYFAVFAVYRRYYSCIFTTPLSLPACSTSSPNVLAPPISTHFCGNKLVPLLNLGPPRSSKQELNMNQTSTPKTREKNQSTRDVFGKRDVVDPRSIAKLRWMLTDCIAASIHVRLTFAKLRCLNLAGQMFDPACHVDHQSWTETCRRSGIDSFAGYHGYLPEPCEHQGEYAWNQTNSNARMKCLQPGLVTITIVNLTLRVMDVQ